MKIIRRPFTILGAATVALVLAAPAAHAETVWLDAAAVSAPNLSSWAGGSVVVEASDLNLPCPGDRVASAMAVRFNGDEMWVKDECADAKSAVGMVSWAVNGVTKKHICRNKRGNGKWVRCDTNWPEGVDKQATAGTYDGDTGVLKWNFYGSVMFAGR